MVETVKYFLHEFSLSLSLSHSHSHSLSHSASLSHSLSLSHQPNGGTLTDSLAKSLHDELWGEREKDRDGEREPSLRETVREREKEKEREREKPHLIRETDKLMHRQRLDQVTAYLDVLNQRAVKKKKLLQALLSLWESTKILLKGRGKDRERQGEREKGEREKVLISEDEIVEQTKSIQNLLLKDMQTTVSVKTSSVSTCFCMCT
jgi:hypothetical protein